MAEPKTKCKVCGISILQRTADRYGMCGRCYIPASSPLYGHRIFHVAPNDTWRPRDVSAAFQARGFNSSIEHDAVNVLLFTGYRGGKKDEFPVPAKIKFHPTQLVRNISVKFVRSGWEIPECVSTPSLIPCSDAVEMVLEECGYFVGELAEFFEIKFSNNPDVAAILSKVRELQPYVEYSICNRGLELAVKYKEKQDELIESVGPLLEFE